MAKIDFPVTLKVPDESMNHPVHAFVDFGSHAPCGTIIAYSKGKPPSSIKPSSPDYLCVTCVSCKAAVARMCRRYRAATRNRVKWSERLTDYDAYGNRRTPSL